MRLNQLTYYFISETGKVPKFNETQNLHLCIDGKITEHLLSSFFEDSSINPGYIKGWSILQLMGRNAEDHFSTFKAKDKEVKITFQAPESEEVYFVKSIKEPTVQYTDKELSAEEIEVYLYKLKILVDASKGEGEDESESAQPQTDEAEPTPNEVEDAEINEPYEDLRKELTEAGFKERVLNDYRIFTKDDREPIFIKVAGNGYDEIEINQKLPIVDTGTDKEYTFYHFIDGEKNMRATYNIEEDLFEISQIIKFNSPSPSTSVETTVDKKAAEDKGEGIEGEAILTGTGGAGGDIKESEKEETITVE